VEPETLGQLRAATNTRDTGLVINGLAAGAERHSYKAMRPASGGCFGLARVPAPPRIPEAGMNGPARRQAASAAATGKYIA
jgi:hypothetical protein